VGSNIAYAQLSRSGLPKHHPDGIFALTTAELVLLDRPDDLEDVIRIARERRRAVLLEDEQRRAALNKVFEQAHQPRE